MLLCLWLAKCDDDDVYSPVAIVYSSSKDHSWNFVLRGNQKYMTLMVHIYLHTIYGKSLEENFHGF